MKAKVRFAVVLSLSFCLPGCLFGSKSQVDYHGRYVSEEQLLQLAPGISDTEVAALLGDPTSRVDIGDGKALWTWNYTRHEKRSNHVFLLLASEHEENTEGAVNVRFDKGKVEKVWRS